MKICGTNTTFDTLHEIQEPLHTNKTWHKSQRLQETISEHCSTFRPCYSLCSSHQIDMVDCTRKMNRELKLLDNPSSVDNTSATCTPTVNITSAAQKLDINMISAALFNNLVQKSFKKDSDIQIFSVTLRDINIALALKKQIDPATKLPSKYHDFLDVFSKSNANILPKHRSGYNYSIELMESKTPT